MAFVQKGAYDENRKIKFCDYSANKSFEFPCLYQFDMYVCTIFIK